MEVKYYYYRGTYLHAIFDPLFPYYRTLVLILVLDDLVVLL